MSTRKQRHARKTKRTLERNVDRSARLAAEIHTLFAELDGTGSYEDACFQLATASRDSSREARAWLKANPLAYRQYLDRQNEMRRKRRPLRSAESITREKKRQRAWESANLPRIAAKRRKQLREWKASDPDAYQAWQRARHEKQQARPGYKERCADAARRRYHRAKAADPVQYAKILDRAKKSNAKRRARIKQDLALLEKQRAYDRERMRRKRAQLRETTPQVRP